MKVRTGYDIWIDWARPANDFIFNKAKFVMVSGPESGIPDSGPDPIHDIQIY